MSGRAVSLAVKLWGVRLIFLEDVINSSQKHSCNSDDNKKLVCALMVPFLYIILAYVGISGFVIVFTVMPIAKELFESTDTPWKF